SVWGNRGRQCAAKLARVARERGTDDNVTSECPDAGAVIGAEPREELFGGSTQQRQVTLHAARHIQHDDEPDRLRCVVEQRDRLRLAPVPGFTNIPLLVSY